MEAPLLKDIFHAYLHRYNKELQFPYKQMTVTDFAHANKTVLKKVVAEVSRTYGFNPALEVFKLYMRLGTENYLKAEGVWKKAA